MKGEVVLSLRNNACLTSSCFFFAAADDENGQERVKAKELALEDAEGLVEADDEVEEAEPVQEEESEVGDDDIEEVEIVEVSTHAQPTAARRHGAQPPPFQP